MSRFSDDDGLLDPYGDDLDLAETIARENPTADQLQHFANLRGAKHAMLDAQAKFVRNVPVSILNGSLGMTAKLGLDQRAQVAQWTGSDAETGPITVTVGQINVPPPGRITIFGDRIDQYAVVSWGTRAALLSAEVDISRGCQFTVSGSMVTIEIVVASLGSSFANYEAGDYTGMISFNPIMRTEQITRTIRVGNTPSEIYTIPAFASSVNIMKTAAGTSGDFVVYDIAGSTIATVPIAAGIFLDSIKLPNAARYFTFRSGGNDVPARVIFNLAL